MRCKISSFLSICQISRLLFFCSSHFFRSTRKNNVFPALYILCFRRRNTCFRYRNTCARTENICFRTGNKKFFPYAEHFGRRMRKPSEGCLSQKVLKNKQIARIICEIEIKSLFLQRIMCLSLSRGQANSEEYNF